MEVRRSAFVTYRPLSQHLLRVVTAPCSHPYCLAVPPTIAEISGKQTMTKGGNVTPKYLADGKPTPKVTWTRLFGNSVVSMTFTDIRGQDTGKYRCTADIAIGISATRDVLM